ncbi:MAG TPA: peptidylprolyl isomerase [Nanoarchaeota archaeon]|nr:peptidylprolyl isomerase [Nanoarchaeota archaeon]
MTETIKQGDFIQFDFVGRIKVTNIIFDLTVADVAKKEGVFDEKREYKYATAIIGEEMLIKGLDKQLEGKEIGKEYSFEVEPELAFGQRNPKMVQITNLAKFANSRLNPMPGMQVNVDGLLATVKSVSGGRVILDFNHPLAGKALSYWIKVNKKVTDLKEKLKIVTDIFGVEAETTIDGKKVIIKGAELGKLPKEVSDPLKEKIKKFIPELKESEIILENAKEHKHEAEEHAHEAHEHEHGTAETEKKAKQGIVA